VEEFFISFHVSCARKEPERNEDRNDPLPPSYYNRLPEQFQRELETARRVGVRAVEVPSEEFNSLAADGAPMIYVVVGGRLLVSKRRADNEHISHAVLANGGPVHAAGEFKIKVDNSALAVSALDNMSGHYRPDEASLEVARTAFESAGVRIPTGAVQSYDWLEP